jgi:hypothetical protein
LRKSSSNPSTPIREPPESQQVGGRESVRPRSRLDSIWYVISASLRPSGKLGSYAHHHKSAEKLIREMETRAHHSWACSQLDCGTTKPAIQDTYEVLMASTRRSGIHIVHTDLRGRSASRPPDSCPPAVLTGTSPPSDTRVPSATNAPDSPTSQRPKSSSQQSTKTRTRHTVRRSRRM